MEDQRALDIVGQLVAGLDPATAQPVTAATWQHPEVAGALASAALALERQLRLAARRGELPPNVGKPWSADEDTTLLEQFDAGTAVNELAERLGRTRTGIRLRLERHGRLRPVRQSSA